MLSCLGRTGNHPLRLGGWRLLIQRLFPTDIAIQQGEFPPTQREPRGYRFYTG